MSIGRLFREADRDLRILLCTGAVLYAADLVFRPVAGELMVFAALLVWRFGLPRPLRFMGLCRGDLRFALVSIAVALPCVVLPGAFAAARWGGLAAGAPDAALFTLSAAIFYQGFLLFGLERRFGAFPAVTLSAMLFAAARARAPVIVLPLLVAGFLLGWLALRTRSLLAPVVLGTAAAVLVAVFSAP